MKRIMLLAVVLLTVLAPARGRAATETWTEMKSAHFTVWSSAGEGRTRDLLWQLEQIRFAVATLWPWTRMDLAKPMLVLAVKGEPSMKAIAPQYWEQKGGVRPVSVWVTGADQHYMALRADLRSDDDTLTNPYVSTYFAYVNLILTSSFGRDLPLWFSRGLAGVMSNTIVRGNEILLGPTIQWHLDSLRTHRVPLKRLLAVTRESKEYRQEQGQFDAQAWALVHFLMFGENAARRAAINKCAALLNSGKNSDEAFAEAFGAVEKLELPFSVYINSSLYSYQRYVIDRKVKREQFTQRPLPFAESAAGRAAFHVGTGRLNEARALIAEARKSDANPANTFAAEGLLLEREGKPDEANAAFAKAASLGSTSAYAYHRAATSMRRTSAPDEATLQQMETHLARATELNPFRAESFAALADVRAGLHQPPAEVIALLTKAVTLDPSDPWIRIMAARALWGLDKLAEARKVASVALALAGEDPVAKAQAERLLATIPAPQELPK